MSLAQPLRLGLSSRARRAQRQLIDALIQAAARGKRTPCSEPGKNLWTSDRQSERARAVKLCHNCVVTEACRAAAEARNETHYVYGGHDFSPRPYGTKS